jgi:hypothetical protein
MNDAVSIRKMGFRPEEVKQVFGCLDFVLSL